MTEAYFSDRLIESKMTDHFADNSDLHSGAACLLLICHYYQRPADSADLNRRMAGEEPTFATLVRTARQLGMRARVVRSNLRRVHKLTLPAVARSRDGNYFILGGLTATEAAIHDPSLEAARRIPLSEFDSLWTGELLLLTPRDTKIRQIKFDVSWFIPSIVKYRTVLTEVIVASLFIQIFALLMPLFFQVVVDKVLVHQGLTTLSVLAIGLAAISIFDVILGGLRTYLLTHTTSRIDVELGAKMFSHLLELPLRYFESRPVGQTVARVRELETVREFLTSSALTVVLDLLFGMIFFVIMYIYSPLLFAVVAGAVPFYAAISLVITPELRRRVEERFQHGAASQSFLVETVTAMETMKSMSIQPLARRDWEDRLAAYVRSSFRTITLSTLGRQLIEFISKMVTVLILFLGARLVIAGDMTIGQLIAFNMFASHVNGPVLRLAQLWRDFQEARISVDRLGDILNCPPELGSGGTSLNLPPAKGAISFQNVSFRYAQEEPEVLSDISFDIQAGEVVGLVGASGSGKSTLTKIVQRLYTPERGRVLVDGTDLSLVDPSWLRAQIGVVLQDNVLFNRSVRANIALGDPTLPMSKVLEVSRLSAAHEFIVQLPRGYDTIIEERGMNLSGGQRQRIAIARALALEPPILIFDEATSALDYHSERQIRENMQQISAGRTMLIVAHRLSTVRHADRILFFDQGRIVEQGNHEDLIALGGRYADLVAEQSR